jgi:hypothetical protein
MAKSVSDYDSWLAIVGSGYKKMNGAGGYSCFRSVLERESTTGVEIAYVSSGCNFLTSDIRNDNSLVNLKVMRIVFGEIERCHSRSSNRLYDSSIDYISTDSSVHPVEMTIPKDLISMYNTVALVVDIGSSPKFFSSQTE